MAEQLRELIDEQVRELLVQGEVALADEDPEGVHQLRVAVRRLRAVLKSWSVGGELRAELRWFFGELGPVRDLDVLLDRFRADTAGFSADELAAVERLLTGLVAERERARRRAAKALRSKRHARLLTALGAATPGPRTTTVDPVAEIAKPHRRLRAAVKAMGPDPADQELHDLRILGKKLRYAAELAGKAAKPLVKATKELQDLLGEHQDSCIAETRLRGLLTEVRPADEAFVAGRLVERERTRQAAVRATWRDAYVAVDEQASAVTA
jgi:CHAD domain-containing protein